MAMAVRPLLLSLAMALLAHGRRRQELGASLGEAESLERVGSAFPVAPWLHLARLAPAARSRPHEGAERAVGRSGPLRSPKEALRRGAQPKGRALGLAAPAWPEPSGDTPEGPRLGASGPGFTPLVAERADGAVIEAYFPVKWAERFAPGSLRLLDAGPGAAMFEAMLDADLETGVAVRVLSTKSREARHELEMLGRLRALSLLGVQNFTCIMSDFERVVQGDWTYILVEASEYDLGTLLRAYRILMPNVPGLPTTRMKNDGGSTAEWQEGMLSVPMSEALPILLDLLRGLRHLQAAGMVHANLSPENVLFVDDRPMIAGLCDVCLLTSEDGFGPEMVADSQTSKRFVSSVLLQPPEATTGAPTSSESHVWTVGVLYVWMRFGYNPVERAALVSFGVGAEAGETTIRQADKDFEGRERLRETLRRNFRLGLDPSFRALGEAERAILRGMLDPNPKSRWSADFAWREAYKLVQAEGIEIAPVRDPPRLPDSWPSDARSVAAEAADGVLEQDGDAWQ